MKFLFPALIAAALVLTAGCSFSGGAAEDHKPELSQELSEAVHSSAEATTPAVQKPVPKEPVGTPMIEAGYSLPAKTLADSYPVGTTEITIEVVNNGHSAVTYTGYYDFRAVIDDEVVVLAVRDDVAFDMQEYTLSPGQTMTQTIPIDIFPTPLVPGTYRLAQLVCFTESEQGAPACSEITVDFKIVS